MNAGSHKLQFINDLIFCATADISFYYYQRKKKPPYQRYSSFPIIMRDPKVKKKVSQNKISQIKHVLLGWLQRIKQKQKKTITKLSPTSWTTWEEIKYSWYLNQCPKTVKDKVASDHHIKPTATDKHLTPANRHISCCCSLHWHAKLA